MNDSLPSDDSLEPLLTALLDGQLTDDQAAKLEALLDEDARAREKYAKIMHAHALLKWSAAAPASVVQAGTVGDDSRLSHDAPDADQECGNRPLPVTIFGLELPQLPQSPTGLFFVILITAGLVGGSVFTAMQFRGGPSAGEAATASSDTTSTNDEQTHNVPSQPPDEPQPERAGRLGQQWKPVWAEPADALPEWAVLEVGREIHLQSGTIVLQFDLGAEVTLRGPVRARVLGPKQLQVFHGDLAARVSEGAKGFSIVTAIGKIIDLGTEFGVSVQQSGSTDLVVFDGTVDVEYRDASGESSGCRLKTGQAVRVAPGGHATRIMQVDSDRFPRGGIPVRQIQTPRVVESIRDNSRDEGAGPYYQISQGGLGEDARAYVDRDYEWNGIDKAGMPKCLLGADYVLMFNDDKARQDLEVTLRLARPADVYVFWDDRFAPPTWLTTGFARTGERIGLDEFTPDVSPPHPSMIGTGAGDKVDRLFSIWTVRVTDINRPVTFGELGAENVGVKVSMYGIAAVALP